MRDVDEDALGGVMGSFEIFTSATLIGTVAVRKPAMWCCRCHRWIARLAMESKPFSHDRPASHGLFGAAIVIAASCPAAAKAHME